MESNRRIKVLHVVMNDKKFVPPVLNKFNKDTRFDNHCLLFSPRKKAEIQIAGIPGLVVLKRKKIVKKYLQSDDYDVVFFYSMSPRNWQFVNYIPQNKTIIWWNWGYELYTNNGGLDPLVNIPLYKIETKRLVENKTLGVKHHVEFLLKKYFFGKYCDYFRKSAISRIDYFQPTIPIELELMKGVHDFRAKEFYPPFIFDIQPVKSIDKSTKGAILMGNSATASNNHLDVWASIKDYISPTQEIIIPLSYGDKNYARQVKSQIDPGKKHNIRFLDDFLPKEQYFELIKNCSYAVFGVIRQQALGNIIGAINNGVKVFLYKDSLVYRYLSKYGYAVFSIESIDSHSFCEPLSKEELIQNCQAKQKEKEYRDSVRERAIEEIKTKLNIKHL